MTREDRLSPDEIATLGDDIAETAAHIDAATHTLLTKLRAFDEADGWIDTGAEAPGRSTGADASARTGSK